MGRLRWLALFPLLFASHFASAQMVGAIDAVVRGPAETVVWGWACAINDPRLVTVYVYSTGDGVNPDAVLASGLTNNYTEPPLVAACGAGVATRRFSIPIPNALMDAHAGKRMLVSGYIPAYASAYLIYGNANRAFVPGSCVNPNTGVTVPSHPIGVQYANVEIYPKLIYTPAELGRGVACARNALRDELLTTARRFYAARPVVSAGRINLPMEEYGETWMQFPDMDYYNIKLFHKRATGYDSSGDEAIPGRAGDARLIQRLAAAAFYADPGTAAAYRSYSRELLLEWARNTLLKRPSEAQIIETPEITEYGLRLGSSMTSFAAGFDLLVAGGAFTSEAERNVIKNWFKRAIPYIRASNDRWMKACRDNKPYDWNDDTNCRRARGDNHVTVGTAALYTLAVMTDDQVLKNEAIHHTYWGYKNRIQHIIYRTNDIGRAPEDRHPVLQVGEIYDRYRGHSYEQTRDIELERSLHYPMLSLSYLMVQAMVAKRQGVNLTYDFVKTTNDPNNKQTVNLASAIHFYGQFTAKYGFGEILSNRITAFDSEANYSTMGYCFRGALSSVVIKGASECLKLGAGPVANAPHFDSGMHRESYFVMAGARFLLTRNPWLSAYPGTLSLTKLGTTDTKITQAYNPATSHNIPFEPALMITD